MEELKIKNILDELLNKTLNKSFKLINDLKLINKLNIRAYYSKYINSFYFVIKTKDLKYCFSLKNCQRFLNSENDVLFLKNYDKLEKTVLNFIENFKK